MLPPGGIITDRLRRATRNAFISQPRRRPAKRQRRQEARRRTQLNADTTSGAQCYPRHACPLDGALLMQVQRRIESQQPLLQPSQLHLVKRCKIMQLKHVQNKKQTIFRRQHQWTLLALV